MEQKTQQQRRLKNRRIDLSSWCEHSKEMGAHTCDIKHKYKKNEHVRSSCAYAYAYVVLRMGATSAQA